MARGRMVNKKISTSKRVNDLPLTAQLLYTWLIPNLDCNGVFWGSAKIVKSLVFPRKSCNLRQVESWLKCMESALSDDGQPLICRYEIKGESYLFMPGFEGEQVGLRKDKESPEYPLPPEEIRKKYGIDTEPIRKNVGVREGKGREVEQEVEEKENISLPPSKYGEFQNVLLSDDEYEKLTDKLGEVKTRDLIERLSGYMKSKKKRYESHYATILNWSRDQIRPGDQDPKKYLSGRLSHLVKH